jgi:hypothetical protein
MADNKVLAETAVDGKGEGVHESYANDTPLPDVEVAKITKVSSILTVLVAGLALFSDGYNAQIIG